MLLDLIKQVIGAAPVGWEFVPYMLAAVLLVCLFSLMGAFFLVLFKRFWRG